MTSVLSSYGQLPTQSKYFIAVNTNTTAAGTTIPSDPTIAAFTLGSSLAPADISTDIIITAISGYSTSQITQGTLFRDLGRKVNIIGIDANPLVGSTTNLKAVYRQMQIVNGPMMEGISTNLFVKVWSADGSNLDSVCVARTG